MSLLLDALKKAALEKQRREQSSSTNSSAPVAPAVPPDEPPKKNSNITDTKPIVDTNDVLAANKIDVEQLNSGLLDIPVVTLDSAPTNQMLNDENDNLVFDINDIDQAFLEPAVQDHPLNKLPETEIVEEFVRKANTQGSSANSPLSMMPDDTTKTAEPTEIQVAENDLVQRNDSPKKAPFNETPQVLLDAENANPLYTEETTTPVITASDTVEVFNTSSGKAALAQLLERSKKAANAARRRMMLMYAFLSVTAIVIVVFYYYLLHSDSSMVVALPPATPASTVTPTAPETTPIAATEVPAEQVPITDEADIATGSLVADGKNTSQQTPIKQASPGAVSESNSQPQPASRKSFKPVQDAATSYSLPPENLPKQAMIVEHKPAADAVSEAVDRGYKAYQRGDIATAGEAYREALEQEPYQRDALLGAAAVAARQGRQQDALKFYQQRLARDPKDEYAQSGILALSENADENPELDSELTRLLLEYPEAGHLHFLKGSLYAARQQWAAAQVSFFEAWQRDNKNPDVAFNLAVALDHLAQPKEAARFYHQALTLGNARPVSFSIDAIQRRLQDLEGTAP